eukprot:TRINITY_DN36236_c0_g1_i1.p1 TRINITY_DN36236_c0_g1~~TRINITY_DN36236_c0_g1_i1.p1  ORF type:complete len:328 (+),score=9.70 TRINITY_DN36236_c0_g1_i1:116-1099(+)
MARVRPAYVMALVVAALLCATLASAAGPAAPATPKAAPKQTATAKTPAPKPKPKATPKAKAKASPPPPATTTPAAPPAKKPRHGPPKSTAPKIEFNRFDSGYVATISPSEGGLAQGACGYGTTVNSAIGSATAAVSSALFDKGMTCGACVSIQCVKNKNCKPDATATVTVTNLCKGNATHGGMCQLPKKSIMLPPSVYDIITKTRTAGDITVRVARVPCDRSGGAQVKVTMGNDWFLGLLLSNLAGPGTVKKVEAQVFGAKGPSAWTSLYRNYGAIWSLNGVNVRDAAVSLRVTSNYNGETILLNKVLPASWQVNQTYTGDGNFPTS